MAFRQADSLPDDLPLPVNAAPVLGLVARDDGIGDLVPALIQRAFIGLFGHFHVYLKFQFIDNGRKFSFHNLLLYIDLNNISL